MMNDYSGMMQDLREADARVQKDENERKRLEVDAEVRNQFPTMRDTGYSHDDYDYTQRQIDGHAALDKPDEPPRLQNKYIKPRTEFVAGADLATGNPVVSNFVDGGGFIGRGIKQLQGSYKTPDLAPPPQDLTALANLAFGSMSEGVYDYEGFSAQAPSYPDNMKRIAWQAAQQGVFKLDLHNQIRDEKLQAEDPPEKEAAPKFPTWEKKATYDEVYENPKFGELSKAFYQELSGKQWEGSDKDARDFGMWWMSAFNWNLTYQVDMAARARFTKNDTLKHLMGTMLTLDENMETDFEQVKRNYASFILDPVNAAPVEKMGGMAAKKAVTYQMKKYLGKELTKMQAAKMAATGGAVASAPVGAAFTGLDEFLRETVQVASERKEGYDPLAIAGATALGGAGGALLGGGAGAAATAVDPTIEFGKQVYNSAMQNFKKPKADQQGFSALDQYHDMQQKNIRDRYSRNKNAPVFKSAIPVGEQ